MLIIILNLVLLEAVLSIDNAAVLATMVKWLPESQQWKALKYGMLWAFVARGICLFIASRLVKIVWLKAIWWLYLLYLCISHFTKPAQDPNVKVIHKWFWATVLMVEVMDIVFSIDNVFAAVALSDHIYVVMAWVFIGIVTMRFVSQWFLKVMQKYPFLEKSAYYVIWLLGVKLVAPYLIILLWLFEAKHADMITSIITILIFVLPILYYTLKNKWKKS